MERKERRRIMIKTKEPNVKRVAGSVRKSTRRPTYTLRGMWENGGLNLGQYRLILSCSLETQKK